MRHVEQNMIQKITRNGYAKPVGMQLKMGKFPKLSIENKMGFPPIPPDQVIFNGRKTHCT